MNKKITIRPEEHKDYKSIISLILRSFQEGTDYSDGNDIIAIVMLAPVSVHADYFHQGIGSAMLKMGIEKVKEMGYKGITVEWNFNFYNEVGFKTASEYSIFPTSGWRMEEPRCMMCQETYEGSLDGIQGYIVYDMYFNA